MKIAMFSGAYVNAGDFLIEKRSKALLEEVIKGSKIDIYKRNHFFDKEMDKLNSYDAIVFAGGPLYQKNIYPKKIPFVKDISGIKSPIMIMGAGWKGKECSNSALYKKNGLGRQMKDFLLYIEQNKIHLGCRDWETVSFLKSNGFANTVMTGCPVWYDLELVEKLHEKDLGQNARKAIEKICISDAAFKGNVGNMKKLIIFIRKRFPNAKIQVLFHRGIMEYHRVCTIEGFLKEYDFSIVDIAGSAEGFHLYDECDLHIGFRVHAHIYNLSIGNFTILLNEDARGNGVNNALGLRNIDLPPQYLWKDSEDAFLEDKLSIYFDYLYRTDFLQYHTAGTRIQSYFPQMKKHIEELILQSD